MSTILMSSVARTGSTALAQSYADRGRIGRCISCDVMPFCHQGQGVYEGHLWTGMATIASEHQTDDLAWSWDALLVTTRTFHGG